MRRRLRKEAAHLEITAFINLIVVLVPFLLATAVFTRLAVIDLNLPPAAASPAPLKGNDLQLEVVIRRDAIEVGDRIGGLIERIPRQAAGAPAGQAVQALGTLIAQIKQKFPDKTQASVLAEPDTPYDELVQVMDAVRGSVVAQGPALIRTPLFPDLSIGDAPLRAPAGARPAGGR
ncbi:MAG: biopolymer transporter ExbD [Burkholderiales bacterium]|nr:biopolymer transporter ExbD [Burkholderiales bacterium]